MCDFIKKMGGVDILLLNGKILNGFRMDLFRIERILLIPEKTIFVESHLIALPVPCLSTLKHSIDMSVPSKWKERMMKWFSEPLTWYSLKQETPV